MDNIKMGPAAYVKKLRARLKTLQARRPGEMRAYNTKVARWRTELTSWLRKEAPKRVKELKLTHARGYYNDRELGFTASSFFEDCPKPPPFPKATPDQMAAIKKRLHFIGVTMPKSVTVSEREAGELFGDQPESEDD